jgi:hypothetical protein
MMVYVAYAILISIYEIVSGDAHLRNRLPSANSSVSTALLLLSPSGFKNTEELKPELKSI